MTDIVERLRSPVLFHSNPEQTNAERREAAAEIERLRSVISRAIRSIEKGRVSAAVARELREAVVEQRTESK